MCTPASKRRAAETLIQPGKPPELHPVNEVFQQRVGTWVRFYAQNSANPAKISECGRNCFQITQISLSSRSTRADFSPFKQIVIPVEMFGEQFVLSTFSYASNDPSSLCYDNMLNPFYSPGSPRTISHFEVLSPETLQELRRQEMLARAMRIPK